MTDVDENLQVWIDDNVSAAKKRLSTFILNLEKASGKPTEKEQNIIEFFGLILTEQLATWTCLQAMNVGLTAALVPINQKAESDEARAKARQAAKAVVNQPTERKFDLPIFG
jgi:hypothetical protein